MPRRDAVGDRAGAIEAMENGYGLYYMGFGGSDDLTNYRNAAERMGIPTRSMMPSKEVLERLGAKWLNPTPMPSHTLEEIARHDVRMRYLLQARQGAQQDLDRALLEVGPEHPQAIDARKEVETLEERIATYAAESAPVTGGQRSLDTEVGIDEPVIFYTDAGASSADAVCVTREPQLGNLVVRYAHRSDNQADGLILPQSHQPPPGDRIWSQTLPVSASAYQITATRIAPGRFHISILPSN